MGVNDQIFHLAGECWCGVHCVSLLPFITTGRGFAFTFTEVECVDTDKDPDTDDDEEVPCCTGWTVLLTTAMVPPL